jgi:hypothetical protein
MASATKHYSGRRDQVDKFARIGTEKVLPQLKRLDSFEGFLVLANRRSGEIVEVTLWESEEAMRVTEGASTGYARSAPKPPVEK